MKDLFKPPARSEKPLHPLRGLPKPRRMLTSYIVGSSLWIGVMHVVYGLVLLIRYAFVHRTAPFIPTWFLTGEFGTLGLGLALGLWTTTLILIQLSLQTLSRTAATSYEQPPAPPDRH